jgi:hypothetical protein
MMRDEQINRLISIEFIDDVQLETIEMSLRRRGHGRDLNGDDVRQRGGRNLTGLALPVRLLRQPIGI